MVSAIRSKAWLTFSSCIAFFKNQGGEEAAMSAILVTGGSGFIGSHSILQLLAAGHQVRTTVPSLRREGDRKYKYKEFSNEQ
jgi:NAD dependent epimerase/dehydratase family